MSLTVPSSRFPPMTLGALNEIAESATVGPTLIVGDWRLVPLADAVIVAVPAATPVIVNDTLDDPVGIATGVCTARTAGLLLASATIVPVGAAAARLTVPCALAPTASVDALDVTLESVGASAGEVGELELAH